MTTTANVEAQCDKLLAALAAAASDLHGRDRHLLAAHASSRRIRDAAEAANFALGGLVAKGLCDICEILFEHDVDYPAAIINSHVDALNLARRSEHRTHQLSEGARLLVGALAESVARMRINARTSNPLEWR